ncbi:MAG: NfeD family protein [Planctomycetota bacterium]
MPLSGRHKRVPWAPLAAAFALCIAAFALAQEGETARAESPTVVVIPLSGLIDKGLEDSVIRRLGEARPLNPALMVFEIDTFGGLAGPAIEITDLLGGIEEPKAVAFVPRKAISAGAMIAMGAREIVLTPASSIGDCAPVLPTPEGSKILGEKEQSPVRSMFRKYAQRNGYPVAIVEAMVTPELEVVQVKYKDGTVKYMLASEYEDLPEEEKEKVDRKRVVVREGEILTLTAEEAEEYGIARFVVADISELLEKYDLADAKVVTLEVNWSEAMVRWVNQPLVASILLLAGLLGLYMEFKLPGVGLPGGVAVVCFAILFFSKYLTGLAVYWEILIFILGLILLGIEIFVIPGFGITGFAGIVLMLTGLLLAYVPSDITPAPIDLDFIVRSGAWFVTTLIVAFGLGAFLAKVLPHTPVVGRFFLGAPQPQSVPHAAAAGQTEGREDLVGKVGRSITMLRPAGRAVIGAQYYDVTTEGDLIGKDEVIEVVTVRGNNIIVRKAK